MRRLICILIAFVLLFAGCPAMLAAPDDGELSDGAEAQQTVTPSDASYFDRIAVIPIDVEIPYFYQQVLNIAGMYIFTTPDGMVHKRIYGALNDVYGWYIPVGPEHIVSVDAQPIDVADDIVMYEEAMAAYRLENPEEHPFTGILPPEDGTYRITDLFGYSVSDLVKYSLLSAGGLCLFILFGFTLKRLFGKGRR